MRRPALFLIVLTLAALPGAADAEDRQKDREIDWLTEVVYDGPINEKLASRIAARWTLDPSLDGWSFGGRYGLRWRPLKGLSLTPLVGGLARAADGETDAFFTASLWSEVRAPHGFFLRLEDDHLIGDRYHHRSFYSLDWWCLGLHVDTWDYDVAAGPHLSSGPGLAPFRVEIRHSLGITADAPDNTVRIVLSIDTR